VAQKVLVSLVDDLTGETADQTVPFSLDGVTYEIDLSEENASELRDLLARYVSSGRRVGGRKIRLAVGESASAVTPGTDRQRSQAIRQWAAENGYAVSERGRIASEIVEAYEQHGGQPVVVEEPVKTPRKRAPRKKVAAAVKGS
jgi:hypothetical protein